MEKKPITRTRKSKRAEDAEGAQPQRDQIEQPATTTIESANDAGKDVAREPQPASDETAPQPSEAEKNKKRKRPSAARNKSTTEKSKPRRRVSIYLDDEDDNDEDRLNIPEVLPVLPLKDTVVYPYAIQPLAVGQPRSIRLLDAVMHGNRLAVLVAQKSPDMDNAGPKDIFSIGTVVRVARMLRLPDGNLQIIVQGFERVTIGEFTQEQPYL